jgi:hypothetical protein
MTEISRRALLLRGTVVAGALAGVGLGVGKGVHHKKAVPPPPPPVALVGLLDAEKDLLAGYDAALRAPSPPLVLPALRGDIAAHVGALAAVLETYPGWRLATATPSAFSGGETAPSPAPTTPAALAGVSRTLATTAGRLCTSWPGADDRAATIVPLLGSISACLHTHAVVLA